MKNVKIISDNIQFQQEFKRCSLEYTHLEMYVAWVGNTKNIMPYNLLNAEF